MFVLVVFFIFFSPGLKKLLTLAINKILKVGLKLLLQLFKYFESVSFLLSKTLQLLWQKVVLLILDLSIFCKDYFNTNQHSFAYSASWVNAICVPSTVSHQWLLQHSWHGLISVGFHLVCLSKSHYFIQEEYSLDQNTCIMLYNV